MVDIFVTVLHFIEHWSQASRWIKTVFQLFWPQFQIVCIELSWVTGMAWQCLKLSFVFPSLLTYTDISLNCRNYKAQQGKSRYRSLRIVFRRKFGPIKGRDIFTFWLMSSLITIVIKAIRLCRLWNNKGVQVEIMNTQIMNTQEMTRPRNRPRQKRGASTGDAQVE